MPRRGLLLEVMFDLPEYVLVDRSPFVIGRNRSCDLPLVSGNVARMHAEIARSGSGWTVRDIASPGTAPRALAVDSRFQIGDFSLRVLALDHEAGDGELTGPITRTARLASPGVTYVLDIEPSGRRWYVVTGDIGRELVPGTPLAMNHTTLLAL